MVVGLNDISLSFTRGEFVAITGESGSGKSTLSHVLGGILPYESGELFFGGNPTSHFDSADWEAYRRDNISFISQNYGILAGATVMENVVSALLLTGMEKREARKKAQSLLKQVELWDLRTRRAAKLSSGQKQRLSIARALAKPAPILIADEPTGNLDPENSAKVIELLTLAAQERLVLLVTHEFSEAQDYATRHIILQDGKVVMDAPLRAPHSPAPFIRPTRRKKTVSLYVARLQQRSRPIWSSFMAVFFALTAFAVFAFLGTLIVNLDDSDTRKYDNSLFKNGAKERIIVSSIDGSALTQEDHEKLLAIDHVVRLEPNGYVSDQQYAYRQGVDFDMIVNENVTNSMDNISVELTTYPRLRSDAPFIQTVPLLPEGQTLLRAGRLPESFYEVLAVGDDSMIGKTLTVYFRAPSYWAVNSCLSLEMQVVGVTDHGEGLYFHEQFGRFWQQVILSSKSNVTETVFSFLPNNELEDDEFIGSYQLYRDFTVQQHQAIMHMSANDTFIYVSDIYKKEFIDLNTPDAPRTLHWAYEKMGGYKFYMLSTQESLRYSPESDAFITSAAYDSYSDLAFYPLDNTDDALASGRYVIWDTRYNVALSTECGMISLPTYIYTESGMVPSDEQVETFAYKAVPVTLDENGVLSGYGETEIWDLENRTILNLFSITHYTSEDSVTTGIDGEEISIHETYYKYLSTTPYNKVSTDYYTTNTVWFIEPSVSLASSSDRLISNMVEVSPATFDALTCNYGADQVSLTIADYGYTDRVLDAAQALGYAAASPYQLGSVKQDETLAQERVQTLIICLTALIAVIALQMILLRAMFITQMDSYRLLSNIGLSAKMAKHSVLWQVLGFALIGQGLSIGALALCRARGVERIVHILHYLPFSTCVLLIAVHLAVSFAAAAWIMSALGKQVYALTRKESDLSIDDTQKEESL